MTGFVHPRAVGEKIISFVQSMRRQAPAARMIGEFAVKQAAKEANKKITGLSSSSSPSTEAAQPSTDS